MAATDEPVPAHVLSPDGTEIGYWTSGEGPPLVLVHGTGSLRATWDPVLPYLRSHATVHAVDRRGRGASGDGGSYVVAREFEDVAAVVDDVAERSGATADLLGHSFGAFCALGAATLTSRIRRLVLYEPPGKEDTEDPSGLLERLEALLAAGDRDSVLETFYREGAMIAEDDLAALRSIPGWWQARLAVAHTIPREGRSEAAFDPLLLSGITVPTLLLVGEHSPASVKTHTQMVAAALPDARVTTLAGQQHAAHVLAPEVFAGHVLSFLRDR